MILQMYSALHYEIVEFRLEFSNIVQGGENGSCYLLARLSHSEW